jgi:hypothetical protein
MAARSAEVFVDENGYFESQGVLYKVDINKKGGRNRASQPQKVGEYRKTSLGRVLFREDGTGTTVKDNANPQHGDFVLKKRADGKFDIIQEYIKDKDGVLWIYTSQNGVRTKSKYGNGTPKAGNTEWLVENGNATRKLREYDYVHGELREIQLDVKGQAHFEDMIGGCKRIWTKDGKGNWDATVLVMTIKGKEIHAKKTFDKNGNRGSWWVYRDGDELKAIKDITNLKAAEVIGKYISKDDVELLFVLGKNGELYHQTGKAAGDEIYRLNKDAGQIETIGKLVNDSGVIRTLQKLVDDNKVGWFFTSADGDITYEYFMENGAKRIYSHKDYDIRAELDMAREFDNDNLKPMDMIHQYNNETGELICCANYYTGSDGVLRQVQMSSETAKDVKIYRSKELFDSSETSYGVGWLLEDANGSIESVKYVIQPYKGAKYILEIIDASRGRVKERGSYDDIIRNDSFYDWMNDRGMFDAKSAMYTCLKANNPMYYGVNGAVRSIDWDPETDFIHRLSGTTKEQTIITLDGRAFSAEIYRDERTKKPILQNILDENENIIRTQFFCGMSSFWQGRKEIFYNSIKVNGMSAVGTQDGNGMISGILQAIADASWQQSDLTLNSFYSKDLE